jgi:hypothetical protein
MGTSDYVIFYQGDGSKKLQMHGFVDVDWVGDVDNAKSTSVYIFTLFEGVVSWRVRGNKWFPIPVLKQSTLQL